MKKSQAEKNIEKKDVIYIRLAQKDDEEIKMQEKRVRDYTDNLGVKISDVYVDNGYSGNNYKRPEFIRMINDVKSNRINSIYALSISRFGRDLIKNTKYMDFLMNNGVSFNFIEDKFNSLENSDVLKSIFESILDLYEKDKSNMNNRKYCGVYQGRKSSKTDVKRAIDKRKGVR